MAAQSRSTLAAASRSLARLPQVITVATHNIMDGLKLPRLLDTYNSPAMPGRAHAGRSEQPLTVLMLQENVRLANGGGGDTAQVIAGELGGARPWGCCRTADGRCATLHDRRLLSLQRSWTVELPRLESLNWIEKLYIKGGVPDKKQALVSLYMARAGGSHGGSHGGSRGRATRRRTVLGKGSGGSQSVGNNVSGPARARRRRGIARSRSGWERRMPTEPIRAIVVANAHLDAAGDNSFRGRQMSSWI